MSRFTAITLIVLVLGAVFIVSISVQASPVQSTTPTPTFDSIRLAQPPTVVPPSQADNGHQIYWGMCSACHGDSGQGLTDEWRGSFPPEVRDCWKSGCHGSDSPENSFNLPETGGPALAGPGMLAQFTNANELYRFIYDNMPLFPVGSITSEDALSLTAYILRINERQTGSLDLSKVNSAAFPVHNKVTVPRRGTIGVLALAGILFIATVGLVIQAGRKHATAILHKAKPDFYHHIHPPSIPAEQARFRYTLGAGGLSIFFFAILLVTGLLLMFYYIPTPEQAASSVAVITTLVPYGRLVRNIHYWSGQFLVVIVTIHLIRVIFTGAYTPPRRFNYLLGIGLFILVLLLDFTGYMLRWDEGIRWALVVGTNLLKTIPWVGQSVYQFVIGGSEPGIATLTRFYTWHIFGLSLVALIFIVWHIFRVRRDGGIAVPPAEIRTEKERITRFTLVRREVLAMLITLIFLLLFSLIFPAPIDQPISSTTALTGDSRAPWFFLWIQQLLNLGNPFLWGVLTPVMVVGLLGLLPYVLPIAKIEELGRWLPTGNRWAQIIAGLIISTIILLTIWAAF